MRSPLLALTLCGHQVQATLAGRCGALLLLTSAATSRANCNTMASTMCLHTQGVTKSLQASTAALQSQSVSMANQACTSSAGAQLIPIDMMVSYCRTCDFTTNRANLQAASTCTAALSALDAYCTKATACAGGSPGSLVLPAVCIITFTIIGVVEDVLSAFKSGIESGLAAALAGLVTIKDIILSFVPGSVQVIAQVSVPATTTADTVANALRTKVGDTAKAAAAFGMSPSSIEEVSAVQITTADGAQAIVDYQRCLGNYTSCQTSYRQCQSNQPSSQALQESGGQARNTCTPCTNTCVPPGTGSGDAEVGAIVGGAVGGGGGGLVLIGIVFFLICRCKRKSLKRAAASKAPTAVIEQAAI